MTSILLIVQIVLVIVLTIAVLLQKSSSIGLGAYSGSNESVFGAQGPGSFLAKVTFTLGFLFVVNTVTLGYFYGQARNASVIDSVVDTADIAAPTLDTVIEPTDVAAPPVETAEPAETPTAK